jgi:ABC-2 type transport system permease protein
MNRYLSKVGSTVVENRNLLIRMVVLPVALLVMLGFLFSKIYVEHIPFGVVDNDNSSLSRNIVRQFRLHPGFQIDHYYDSEKSLEQAILKKEVLGGVVIPSSFYRNLLESKTPGILALIDGTNVIVATYAQGYATTVLGTMNVGFQINLLEGKGMLPSVTKSSVTSFSYTERVLFEPTLSYLMYLIYMIFLYTVQTLYFGQFLVPYLMEKKARWAAGCPPGGWRREVVRTALLPVLVMVTLEASTYTGLMIGYWLFGIHVLGNLVQHAALVGVFLLGLTGLGIFVTAIVKNHRYFLEAYYIFAIVLLLSSGVAWPAYMFPPGVDVVIQLFWPLFNDAYTLKALHLKGLTWDLLAPTLLKGTIFAVFWGGLGVWLHRRFAKRLAA